ncbi:uncharacterized protein IUM83_08312 [Phytophthora cinnamomi]|uniref:uncharacterized protein n=1 Tax=Phytophthora cinnamomi TaxID=4785 RepID=UPI00355991B3|nr:hypothetical protein IUM83_08312 [Phytophthora cinnamomi]
MRVGSVEEVARLHPQARTTTSRRVDNESTSPVCSCVCKHSSSSRFESALDQLTTPVQSSCLTDLVIGRVCAGVALWQIHANAKATSLAQNNFGHMSADMSSKTLKHLSTVMPLYQVSERL